jgi:MFS transporter, MHS family, proline/betaine transporter
MISVIVALFGITLTTLLTHQQLVDWGRRIPYVFGLLVGPAGLYNRSRMEETPEFLEAAKPRDRSDRRLGPPAAGAGVAGARRLDHLQQLLLPAPLYPDLRGEAAPFAGLDRVNRDPGGWRHSRDLLAGGRALVDRTPRTRIMLAMCWLFFLTSYPVFYLIVAWPSLAIAIFAVSWLNLIKAGYSGVLPSLISEQFPVETRAIGVAFSYSISATVFGGFAPFVATWLITATDDALSPSYYLAII